MLRLSIGKIVNQNQQCSPIITLAARLKPTSKLPNNHSNIINVRNHHTITKLIPVSCQPLSNHYNLLNARNIAPSSPLILARTINSEAKLEQDQVTEIGAGTVNSRFNTLERAFNRFEDKCQRAERVLERDFVKIFDLFTKVVEQAETVGKIPQEVRVNLALLAAILLRCCGRLMCDTSPKHRELLAGNLWHFLHEKKIPVDASHYNSLIRALNENSTNFEPEKILQEMASKNLTPDRVTYQRLIHQYCMQGDIAQATSLLEKMKDLGLELNESTFASLIIGYSKQENPPSVTDMFELMKSNGVDPGSKSYSAAIISLVPQMQKKPEIEEELKKTIDIVESEETQFTINEVIDMLTQLAPHKSNETVSKLFKKLLNSPIYTFNDRYRFTSGLLSANLYEEISENYWKQKPNTRSTTNNIGVYYMNLMIRNQNVPADHIEAECVKLRDMNYNPRIFESLFYNSAEIGRLDLVRIALKHLSEEGPVKCHYYWPLLAQAKDEDEVINTLKNDFSLNLSTGDLLETFSQWVWPRFENDFTRLFELNKEKLHFDNNLIMASFLNYSVQENKIAEAIKFVSEAPQTLLDQLSSPGGAEVPAEEKDQSSTTRNNSGHDRGFLITRLLNNIVEQTKDPELVNKAFKLCQVPGQQVSARALSSLVKVHLVNDDFPSALKSFLELSRDYRYTPCKSELITHCLEKKDPESLQKIMDASTDIHGETNALFDLAVCCLQCNKIKQAKKIFLSPNFRVNPPRIYTAARGLAKLDDVIALENFVHFTRDMYDVNQEMLYQMLIDKYEQTANGNRVLDLWNRMQEEEFQPSRRSLAMIADVLERNGIAIPFQRPNMDARSRSEQR